MIFDIFGSGNGKNPFPGYELKIGELCSIPAKSGTANGGLTQTLDIPAGCVPLCLTLDGNFKVNSGKGESPGYHLWVKDSNDKVYYNAERNGGSGYVESGSSQIVLNPIGAYGGDVEQASTITAIKIEAASNSWSIISDYALPKISVAMWLEKTGSGGAKPVKPKEYKRLYLYKDGDQCTDVTGGWVFTKPASPAGNYTSSLNKDGEMYCGGQNSGNATFGTVNSINMSDYDHLLVEFHFDGNAGDGNASFFVMAGGTEMIKINISTIAKNKICLAGTSELAGGNVQLKVNTGGYSTTRMYIKRVWLETVGE